jgi:hypothetical protein
MGDGVRSQIWAFLDDPDFGPYESLRNAIYRLLVASVIPLGSLASSFDPLDASGCLELAAAAVRENNAAVAAHACDLVDDLVARLATLSGLTGVAQA